MATLSAQEAMAHRIKQLGSDRGTFVKHLEDDLSRLRLLWKEYSALFATRKERIELINLVAGDAFFWIQKSMFESIMMSVCRLSDREFSDKEKTQRNISIHGLPNLLSEKGEPVLLSLIEKAKSRRHLPDRGAINDMVTATTRPEPIQAYLRKSIVCRFKRRLMQSPHVCGDIFLWS